MKTTSLSPTRSIRSLRSRSRSRRRNRNRKQKSSVSSSSCFDKAAMALKRGLSSSGANKNRSGGGGSSLPILLVIFFCVLSPLIFFVGRGLNITSSPADQNNENDNAVGSGKQQLDWRERLALQHVIDVITSSTADLGPLSLDSFRKNKLSASWKVIGGETLVDNKAASETNQTATVVKQEASKGKEDNSQSDDTPAKLARRGEKT
uniref:Uncharacterized protein n=1 Tax=Salix viminalis TaxID=40686 RepID=A0A6N2MSD3_SALVM